MAEAMAYEEHSESSAECQVKLSEFEAQQKPREEELKAFVGRWPPSVDADVLRKDFEECGPVSGVKRLECSLKTCKGKDRHKDGTACLGCEDSTQANETRKRKEHTVRAADYVVVANQPRVYNPTPPDPGGPQPSPMANMLVTDDNMSHHSKIHDE